MQLLRPVTCVGTSLNFLKKVAKISKSFIEISIHLPEDEQHNFDSTFAFLHATECVKLMRIFYHTIHRLLDHLKILIQLSLSTCTLSGTWQTRVIWRNPNLYMFTWTMFSTLCFARQHETSIWEFPNSMFTV